MAGLFAPSRGARAQAVTMSNVEFGVRSATIYGSNPNLRILLGITNKGKDPAGLFVLRGETSASLDTGKTYHGYSITSFSGIGVCGSARNDCVQQKQSYLITLPGGLASAAMIEFQGDSSDADRQQGRMARLVDLVPLHSGFDGLIVG